VQFVSTTPPVRRTSKFEWKKRVKRKQILLTRSWSETFESLNNTISLLPTEDTSPHRGVDGMHLNLKKKTAIDPLSCVHALTVSQRRPVDRIAQNRLANENSADRHPFVDGYLSSSCQRQTGQYV
jgi:hypothetical protein